MAVAGHSSKFYAGSGAEERRGAANSSGDDGGAEWKIRRPLGRIRTSHDRICVG
jgi:hypothetical protein